jgi:hypothetical protein
MLRLIRFLLSLLVIAAVVYFAVAVPLGKKTLWQHLKAIAGTQESQNLVDEVKHKAGSVIRRDGATGPEDKLSDQERKLLRKLIREKNKPQPK